MRYNYGGVDSGSMVIQRRWQQHDDTKVDVILRR